MENALADSSRTGLENGMIRGMQKVDLAYARVASSELARDINRDVILELVRAKQPLAAR